MAQEKINNAGKTRRRRHRRRPSAYKKSQSKSQSQRVYLSSTNKSRKHTGRRLKILLIPSAKNDYRPLLIRRYGLAALLILITSIQLFYNFSYTGSVLGQVTTVTSAGLLVSTNDARADAQLAVLNVNPSLTRAAEDKAQDMLTKNYWSHNSPDGTEPWEWIDKVGYSYEVAGENLAKNFSSSSATVRAWLDSPSHRDNLLGDKYQDVGFGIVSGKIDGKPSTIITAFYAKPTNGQVLSQTDSQEPGDNSASEANFAISFISRVGIALQSLTPAAIVSLALLFVAATVAITAQFYRSKLPKHLQQSWYRNHGTIKAAGLIAIAAFMVLIYGGAGQI